MNMTDVTGQPHSDEDLQEAINAVEKTMLNILSVPPKCLKELQTARTTIIVLTTKLEQGDDSAPEDIEPHYTNER